MYHPTRGSVCCGRDRVLFGASQNAFFGGDVVEEIELGGAEEDQDNCVAVLGGRFVDDELHEYHLFEKDETGQETDFVLVSCTGSEIEPTRREQDLKDKMAGEDSLRRPGLGYTINRPGPLMEEPGGQRALIFDQGNCISQVCYEYVAEPGKEVYELISALIDTFYQ